MILGIEATAHTFGIGIVHEDKIIANVRDSYTTEQGGIIPQEAAKHHENVAEKIYEKALHEARVHETEIEAIAFSQGPGLPPCLLTGLHFTRQLAKKLEIPVVPVNHCIAHLEIGRLTGARDPVMLYVSGANTQIIAYASGKFCVFGETLDTGVGNFLDSFARYAGIGFPGGPKLAKLAAQARTRNKGVSYIELPYSIKGMDVSFSGMLTKLKQLLDKGYALEELAFSTEETAFAMLVEAAERAMAHTGKEELLLGGGVACNARLQEMARIMCQERGGKFFCPPSELLVDNGAMIAYLGEIMLGAGVKLAPEKLEELDIKPRQRTDEVEVVWR